MKPIEIVFKDYYLKFGSVPFILTIGVVLLIIVIRKCGLDLYVSSEITSRALSEIKKINMTINDDDEIDEDYENEEGDNKTVELEKK